MSDIECPYCEEELEICHDDGFGYEEGIAHQMECKHCGKSFIFQTSISFYFVPSKADCLNGDEHKWEPTTTYPKEFSQMQCSTCFKERKPTKQELLKIMSNN